MKRVVVLSLVAACAWAPPVLADDAGDGDEETIVVSANRRAVPLREVGASVSVVTAAELEAQGIFYVEDVLRRLPGVQASSSGGRGGQVAVRLRGEESYRTLVLVDGIRVADGALPQAAVNFGNLTVTAIDRIEVLRGPQALLYGADAIGGVINIVTRRGGEDAASLGVEAGSNETYTARGFVGGARDRVDLALSGDYTRTDGISAKVGDATLADDDGYRNLTLHGVVGAGLSEGTRLEIVGRYSDSYAQFDGFSFDPDRDLLTQEVAARVALTSDEIGEGLHHLIAYNFYQVRRTDLDGGQPTRDYLNALISRFDTDRHEAEYLVSLDPINGHGFTAGASYLSEEVTTDAINDTTTTFAAYAEWQAEWTAHFFSTVGLRFDAPEDFDNHVSLRATAAYLVPLFEGTETKFRASAGTGFRAPSAYERAYNAGAGLAELSEETGIGFDVGVDQPFMHGAATLSLTYFDQRIEDEIRYDNVNFTGYFQSSGRSHSRGVEAGLEAALTPNLSASLSYTYTDATVTSPDAEDGLPRVRRPQHMGSVDLDYVGDGQRLRVNVNARGVDDNEDGFREFRTDLSDYLVFGAAMSYAVTPHVALTLRGANLTDADYMEVDGFSTPGREVFVGLRVRY